MVYRPQYFSLNELVCKHVYDKFGDFAWTFLDEKVVITLDTIRRLIGKPITVNTWADGSEFSQRGLRCNICSLVKEKTLANQLYMSAHILGMAMDFDVEGMSADEVRVWIAVNKDKLPYNIRLERGTAWVHLDVYDNGTKLTFFNP